MDEEGPCCRIRAVAGSTSVGLDCTLVQAPRETLRAYLEHSQSVSATAALRRRDRKTIERQLRSAEQLMHHRVSARSDEVLLALRVAEIFGTPRLDGRSSRWPWSADRRAPRCWPYGTPAIDPRDPGYGPGLSHIGHWQETVSTDTVSVRVAWTV